MNSPQTISQQASAPEQNVVIEASAGTGKTYLLITRLARLLLEGAEPDQILAITFTRKAAAEMQQRLTQRLYNWLSSDETTLEQSLQAIGVDCNAAVKQRARQLYEQSLRSVQQVKITTFHAFCQDILRRFPLEADIPPGFDLSESSGLLEQQAWDALWSEATLQPDGELATDLQTLLLHCQGLDSCRTALFEFLHHRSDWWALHESHNGDRARHAVTLLQQQLDITAEEQPYRAFFSADTIAALNEYHDLLQQHSNTTNQGYGADIAAALNNHQADIQQAFNQATKPFLKQDLQPRAMKASKARAKAMGEQGQQRFLQLHETLTQALLACIDLQRRQQTWALSSAWYRCGDRLVNHYQRLKTEQRLLDFTDLEWQTYRLLNHAEHSHWVQYKLDQRINHILVDEFQDTNPTQWRLLLPLFQELASTQPSPSRESLSHHSLASVFLVGDIKQSIYRFRRADPELFTTAQHWLQQHLAAHTYPLAVSWRSSPAIIDFVNRVFSQPDFARYLPDFPRHDTHQTQLAGRVEFMPPIQHVEAEPTVIAPTSLRNPLLTPRLPLEQPLHYREGRQIAARIQQLVDGHYSFDGDKLTDYSDILILVKRRTHCHHYEQALREAGIPYQTSGKTTLFDSLEIQDMLALLETLMTPHNNLALATVLRSPLFACSNEELVLLSQHSRQADSLPWFDGLIMLAATAPAASALQRAAHWLPQWMQWVGVLPVHDLLDRIYSQANVIARFSAAFPAHLRQRVQANLTRFIELALEIDSGRYPSLPHFVAYLRSLHELAPDVLSEPHESQQQNCVQIMTIHAAKGLEAPIVFLADSGYQRPQSRAWQALINWPAASRQPDIFLLTGRKNELDNWSQQRIAEEEQQEQREDANLLYVALTRAKQGLYISACASGRQHGWYETLAQAYAPQYDMDHISQHGATVEQFGTLLTPIKAIPPATTTPPELEVSNELIHALRQPLFTPAQDKPIKPSATATDTDRGDSEYGDHHGRLRGQIIHRLLEHTIPPGNTTVGRLTLTDCLTQFQNEVVGQLDPHELEQWADEAQRLIEQPELQAIFDPQQYRSACNEMSLNYNSGQQSVHGIIDRLVITNDDVIIIDYKTHRDATAANIKTLAESYRQQMQYYANGVAQCWPGKRIRMMLIFTACGESVEL